MPPASPLRECLARVSALLVESPRAPRKALVAAVAPLFDDALDANWHVSLALALLRWNHGAVHEGLAAALPAWEARDLRAGFAALDIVVGFAAAGHGVTFASFDLDRLVFATRAPRPIPKRASVYVNDQLVASGDAVGGLVALGEVAFLLRTKKRWRAVYGDAKSRPFDRVERGVVHGEHPVYVVRDGAKRRVIEGASDGPSFARVTLPAWGGTMLEAAPEFFVEYEDDGPLVYAAKGKRGWTVVRDGEAEKLAWDKLEDLVVRDGEPCYRASVARRWVVVEGMRKSPAYDEVPKVTWVGGRAVYRARSGKRWTLVDADRYRHWYDELTRGEMRDGEPFYAGRDHAGWWVHHGERRWGPYAGVSLLPPPFAESADEDEGAPTGVAYAAMAPDHASEAVYVDGRAVAAFEGIFAAHWTTAGVVCAGYRAGKVVVRDVDGTEVASADTLAYLDPESEAFFDRVDGETWFISMDGRKQRLHAGAWASAPFDEVVPLWLTCRGEPVYGARESRAWSVRVGAAKHPVTKRPEAAWRDDDADDGSFTVTLAGGKTVDVVV